MPKTVETYGHKLFISYGKDFYLPTKSTVVSIYLTGQVLFMDRLYHFFEQILSTYKQHGMAIFNLLFFNLPTFSTIPTNTNK
jgi:hypothetical protein